MFSTLGSKTLPQKMFDVGRNKTTQACPEPVEGRSAWWRFQLARAAVRRKRLFSLTLEKTYSGLSFLQVV